MYVIDVETGVETNDDFATLPPFVSANDHVGRAKGLAAFNEIWSTAPAWAQKAADEYWDLERFSLAFYTYVYMKILRKHGIRTKPLTQLNVTKMH